jgi:hypothetical protein
MARSNSYSTGSITGALKTSNGEWVAGSGQ